MDPDSSPLQIAVTDGQGRPVRAAGLRAWLASVAPARARGALAIALVSDAEIRALNRRFRNKDESTDVLSFPGDTAPVRPQPEARRLDPAVFGDLVIATGVARRQAAEAGHGYGTELKVLALHGLLHLLGYDHHAPDDNRRMARVEARLRRKGGLGAGLIERAASTAGARPSRAPSPAAKARRSRSSRPPRPAARGRSQR